MKLQEGSIVEIFGWVMLNKIESGKKYRVRKIYKHSGYDVYSFTFARGTKEIVNHYVENVDLWIKDHDVDLNRIEIIKY